jgi:hypothetical protein
LRGQFLLHIFQEELAVESTVHDHWSEQAVESKRGDESGCIPMAVGHRIADALACGPPTVEACHRGGTEGFVQKNQATWIDARCEDLPRGPIGDHIRSVLLGRPKGLFLRLILSSLRAYHKLEIDVSILRSRLRSSSVELGLAAT